MKPKPQKFSPKKPCPLMWDDPEENQKQKSLKNERRLSKKLDFKLTPGSGNRVWPGDKGDGQTKRFMFECKETKFPRISVGENDLLKLVSEANTAGKEPVLVLSIYGMSEFIPKDWVAMPADVFKWLVDEAGVDIE
jgi:Holliday junction resolvase